MIDKMLLAMLLLLLPHTLLANPQFQAEPRTYTANGTVINSVTGEAIGGALVQISGARQLAMLTGADGKFQFEGLANGTFPLSVRKPGYFSPEEIRRAGTRPVLVSTAEERPVTLRLVPEGVIYGRISGDGGEPLENIPVQIVWEHTENGRKARDANRTVQTDEQGEFRVPELQQGRYFIFAGPSYWPVSFPTKISQSVARGYTGLFYPGVPDLASATPVEITPGKHTEVNLTLTSQPYYRISGSVSGYSPEMPVQLQILSASGQELGGGLNLDEARGTFRSWWFPAGPCTITAQAQDSKTNQQYFASQPLNVTSDLAGVHLTLAPGAVIPVNARVEATRETSRGLAAQQTFFWRGPKQAVNQYSPARVMLTARGRLFSQQQQYSQSATEEDPALAIRNVPPGVYSVEVQTMGDYYVQSARSGSVDLLEQTLTVAPGDSNQPIEIVLRDDFASLEGNLTFDGRGDTATVLIIPTNQMVNAQATRLEVSATSGSRSFQIPQLAPGEYKVLAVYDPEKLEDDDPEAMGKYLSRGQHLSLAPNQKARVEMQVMRIGE